LLSRVSPQPQRALTAIAGVEDRTELPLPEETLPELPLPG